MNRDIDMDESKIKKYRSISENRNEKSVTAKNKNDRLNSLD